MRRLSHRRRVIRNRILLAVNLIAIVLLVRTLLHLAIPLLREVHAAGKRVAVAEPYGGIFEEGKTHSLRTGEPLIILDAGHGGHDVGCEREDVYEKDVNLKIALKTKDAMEEAGYSVWMTRTDDSFVSLEDRVEAANRWYREANDRQILFLSIHCNALEDDRVTDGMELYACAERNAASARLLQAIERELPLAAGSYVRKRSLESDFYVVANTFAPACLVETGFLSSDEEARRLTDEGYQERLAEGLVNSVRTFLAEDGF